MAKEKTDTKPHEPQATASGVEELIKRLRVDGVEAGRAEAEKIIGDAESRANWVVNQANDQAEEIISNARKEADRFRSAAEEALQVAARDAVLQMKGQLAQQFSDEIGRLVREEIEHEVLLERLILAVAGRVRDEAGLDAAAEIEILLPAGARNLADLRDDPDELRNGELSHFVVEIAGKMLRQGVTLTPSAQIKEGIRIRLTDQQIEIDLSSESIAKHLLEHLQPRFRALLEGMVY